MTQSDAPRVTMHELTTVVSAVAALYAAEPEQTALNTLTVVIRVDETVLPGLDRWHRRAGRAKKKMIDAAFAVLQDAGLFTVSADRFYIRLTPRGEEVLRLVHAQPDVLSDELEVAIEGSQHFVVIPPASPSATDAPTDELPAVTPDLGSVPPVDAVEDTAPLPAMPDLNSAEAASNAVADAPTPPATSTAALDGLEGLALTTDEPTTPRTRHRRNLPNRPQSTPNSTSTVPDVPAAPSPTAGTTPERDDTLPANASSQRLPTRPQPTTTAFDTPFSQVSNQEAPTEPKRERRSLSKRPPAPELPARRLRRTRLDERLVGPRATSTPPPAPAPEPEPIVTLSLRDGRVLQFSRYTLDLLIAEHGSLSSVILWYERNENLLNDAED